MTAVIVSLIVPMKPLNISMTVPIAFNTRLSAVINPLSAIPVSSPNAPIVSLLLLTNSVKPPTASFNAGDIP